MRGYFQIGVYHPKKEINVGTLWRSAYQLGAAGIFTVGRRYQQQACDTAKSWRHIPLTHYSDIDDLIEHLPYGCPLVAIEMGGMKLSEFKHPERAAYILGAEDHGLPWDIIRKCHEHVKLECVRTESFNVAVAGSIVLYDRLQKHELALL